MRGVAGEVISVFVMCGHSPSKTGVNALMAGHPRLGDGDKEDVDGRVEPGHDAHYREHSIATKLSQPPEHALLLVGTAPVISSRSILRNDFASANACDWQ